jgi:hypothetical protein
LGAALKIMTNKNNTNKPYSTRLGAGLGAGLSHANNMGSPNKDLFLLSK